MKTKILSTLLILFVGLSLSSCSKDESDSGGGDSSGYRFYKSPRAKCISIGYSGMKSSNYQTIPVYKRNGKYYHRKNDKYLNVSTNTSKTLYGYDVHTYKYKSIYSYTSTKYYYFFNL